jgi:hypothetical protein
LTTTDAASGVVPTTMSSTETSAPSTLLVTVRLPILPRSSATQPSTRLRRSASILLPPSLR